jgi:hypothetical protein
MKHVRANADSCEILGLIDASMLPRSVKMGLGITLAPEAAGIAGP